MNKDFTAKIVKGVVIGVGTLLGVAVSACIKAKPDEFNEVDITTAVDVPFEEVPVEEVTEPAE